MKIGDEVLVTDEQLDRYKSNWWGSTYSFGLNRKGIIKQVHDEIENYVQVDFPKFKTWLSTDYLIPYDGNRKIQVWKASPGEGYDSCIFPDPNSLFDHLKDCLYNVGDSMTVEVLELTLEEYYNLPEFQEY